MPNNDLVFFRHFFKLRLAQSRGQEFQNFFTQVMTYAHRDFQPVRTQGPLGDQKNDGFIPSTGTYFQVYAPGGTLSEAEVIKKLKEDFEGLYTHWASIYPQGIRKFFFAINDFYNWSPGAYPTTHKELEDIKHQHDLEECAVFPAVRLEEVFMTLPRDLREALLGAPIPQPEAIGQLNFGALDDVIRHIYENPASYSQEGKLAAPEFDEKIMFNGLTQCGDYLRYGAWQCYAVENFFASNGAVAASEVRDKLNGIYNELVSSSAEADSNNLFFALLDAITPTAIDGTPRYKRDLADAGVVLIAYFFESCDVFEEPINDNA